MVRLGVEIFGGLIAAVALVVVVAAWRLSEGPVRTDFLTPYLQAAVNQSGGNTVGIGGSFLVWEEGSRGLVLHASGITVRDPEGRLIASLPEVAFGLSTGAVLAGTLALDEIEIIAPRIRLHRDRDGRISFGGDAATPEPAEAVPGEDTGTPAPLSQDAAQASGSGEDVVVGRMVREMLGERSPDNALSYLNELRIRDGQLFMRDDLLGLSWAAPAAEISLRRDVAGLAGDVSLGFARRGDPATLDIAFLFDKTEGIVDLAASFSDISLANLANAFPELAPVGGVTSRISGSVFTSLSLEGEIGHTGFELEGFAGTLAIPGLDMQPVPVRDLTMRGRYDSTESRFDLDEARISLGTADRPGPVFSIAGVFDHDRLTRDWVIDVDAALEDVPVAELDTYWPKSVAPNARPWVVENVTAGTVDKATAALDVKVNAGDFEAAEVTALSGTLLYRGVDVHYLRPLDPLRDLAGTATFDLDALRFEVAAGQLNTLAIGASRVDITGFSTLDANGKTHEQMSIQTNTVGPVSEALTILEHPRLDLLSALGFSAAGSGGTVSAELGFQFPLKKDLGFDDVTLQTAASVRDGALQNVLLGQDMSEAQLNVELDESGLQLSGPLKFGGVPLTMSWQESFAEAPEVRSIVEAEIPRIDDAERARFGLDIGDVVQGPLKASISMVQRPNGLATLQASADLQETTISLPEIHWRKEAGTEGSLSMVIELDGAGPLAFRDIVLQAGDLVARGKATPGAGREGLGSIELERVAFGRSNLENVSVELSDAGIDAAIGSGVLDAEPFLADDEAEETAQSDSAEPRSFEPLRIHAPDLRMLYFAEERHLEQVNLELRRVAARNPARSPAGPGARRARR
jgi:hypothetical protein